ncbi:hypothetical protein GCM10025791_06880 [Halioxenophilus aromaticivorans]|uniref:Thioesterase domain-containing protein n=2 Tax=Halioxenophilus aromaticivorans TaxID=1306992 RepID=A0AAV3TXW0_9ALTE
MVVGVVEDWFSEALNWSFQEMHLEHKLGVPTVSIECQFQSACRIGDTIDFSLTLAHLGNSSCTVHIVAQCQDRPVFDTKNILVLTELSAEALVSRPFPESYREKMKPYLEG